MDDNRYPHEKIAAKLKSKPRNLKNAAVSHRIAHKATPTKLCNDRKVSRAPGKCITLTAEQVRQVTA
jgi:hypothetical protein